MKTTTAYNHLVRLKGYMASVYSAARSYGSPHQEILERLKESVWNDPALKKCPAWVNSSLSNYSLAKLDEIHQHYVVWAFIDSDGKIVPWEALDEQARESYCTADKTGAFYWVQPKLTGGKSTGVFENQTITRVWNVTNRIFA